MSKKIDFKKLSDKQLELLGQDAMEYLSEYPLYASTSNITYKEAILIAEVLGVYE